MQSSKKDILARCKDETVHFLRLQFTDIDGVIKNVEVPKSQFEKALDGQIMFDGSSIEGFTRIEESDMLLVPDLVTFSVFPWQTEHGKVEPLEGLSVQRPAPLAQQAPQQGDSRLGLPALDENTRAAQTPGAGVHALGRFHQMLHERSRKYGVPVRRRLVGQGITGFLRQPVQVAEPARAEIEPPQDPQSALVPCEQLTEATLCLRAQQRVRRLYHH